MLCAYFYIIIVEQVFDDNKESKLDGHSNPKIIHIVFKKFILFVESPVKYVQHPWNCGRLALWMQYDSAHSRKEKGRPLIFVTTNCRINDKFYNIIYKIAKVISFGSRTNEQGDRFV